MRRRLARCLCAAVLAGACGGSALAQQVDDPPVPDALGPAGPVLETPPVEGPVPGETVAPQDASAILTVDIERLYGQSQFGLRITEVFTAGSVTLNAENRRIADALRAEELALAAQRAEMAPNVFRTEAAAFDDKAQAIRRAQDAKQADLEAALGRGRTQFLDASRPILGQLMIERGAYAILDRRSVLLSLGSIDITDAAIEAIDAAIGDGAPTDPAPQGEN